mmetsp:Transcript_25391/g.28385  ORF Transcript_25391/g.28385 Transcript_25391/m.28385 type:complete len:335 (-) Transcript_25391:229-1233(-)
MAPPSALPPNTPKDKNTSKRLQQEADRRDAEELRKARVLVHEDDARVAIQASQRSQRMHSRSHTQTKTRAPYKSRNSNHNNYDCSSEDDNGSEGFSIHDEISVIPYLSNEDKDHQNLMYGIIGTLQLYDKNTHPFGHKLHPEQPVARLLQFMKGHKCSDMCLDLMVEYDILDNLLKVLPKIIDANNNADNVDVDILEKQAQVADKVITAVMHMMSNLPLGKRLIDRLTDDDKFLKLFYEDEGKEGYSSNILKNKVAMGLWFALVQFYEYNTNMKVEDKNKMFKLLQKLSSKIDDKKFGEVGGLEKIDYLFKSTKNEEHKKSLWSIINDMWKAQQ